MKTAKKLANYFSQFKYAIIAYSGGVDSGLLAFAAHRVLGNQMLAVIADSPSLARREYDFAKQFAEKWGIPLKTIHTQEMDNPSYLSNSGKRCYYCKKTLFQKIETLNRQIESKPPKIQWPIFYGANKDDLSDYRPGMQAANEKSIIAPYIELDIDKQTIRDLCAYYSLELADKPAAPCLASRISYGEHITLEKLNQVEAAEDFLHNLGFRTFRVRHHGHIARIEALPNEFNKLLINREKICQAFRRIGFLYISMDLCGFKSGSLNAALNSEKL